MDKTQINISTIQPSIYTIIVTYNGMQWIDRCISSLLESVLPTHILVIDNLSTDGTPDYIEQHFPQVELIRSEQNLGFGKGNNIGMQKALEVAADYVFLLNQDAWIKPDTLQVLVNAHKSDSEYGVLSPVHLNAQEDGLETKFAEYTGPENTRGLLSDLYKNSLRQVYTTKFVNAAAWLISLECLSKVGGFNPLFPHYGEDEDYINRVHYWDFKVGIVPKAQVTHDSIFSWEKIEHHPVRNVIFNLIPLANINHRYRSAWLLFLKKSMDELSTLLLFRKFKKFKTRFKAFWQTLKQYKKIKDYRQNSLKPKSHI
ncbi:glycosyltransferase family 2 protein [Carboxylicivirga sediminis]|uniref:Glycosyltransferase family 2 protein n=1 Tax=Carboxylicivirga sediminis TaxID=2006564 RepID=A0A941F3M7_9BACT|nr:glycosyltransferase family 2 protein [Carboxylicivirga sediminis]MBR8535742.1 glycosyltransferase family 2 protein [Carboxylicivirga sediminis]